MGQHCDAVDGSEENIRDIVAAWERGERDAAFQRLLVACHNRWSIDEWVQYARDHGAYIPDPPSPQFSFGPAHD